MKRNFQKGLNFESIVNTQFSIHYNSIHYNLLVMGLYYD